MSTITPETAKIQFENAVFLPEIVKMLNEGHTVTLTLKGYSMRDKALFVKPSTVAVGDPVLAEIAPQHYVLHRIIHMKGENVTLLGDGNLSTEHCLKSDVVGAVIGFYRKGRKTLDRTNGWKWRSYSFVWTRLYPIRRYLLGIYRRIWIPIFGVI